METTQKPSAKKETKKLTKKERILKFLNENKNLISTKSANELWKQFTEEIKTTVKESRFERHYNKLKEKTEEKKAPVSKKKK